MPVPDFQTFFRPVLQTISDGKVYSLREVMEQMARTFHLSEEDRRELLPSGTQYVFDNRVSWAKTYLKKAGLLTQPQRAHVQITDRGLQVLNAAEPINIAFLKQFPAFRQFHEVGTPAESGVTTAPEAIQATPDEKLQAVYKEIISSLAQELLERVKNNPPIFFEKLVVDLMLAMGYGGSLPEAGQVTRASRDGGIDGLIKEDKLGLDLIYLQAKRWQDTVGRPEIEKFVGALAAHGAKKGVFVTTGIFSKEAQNYIPRNDTRIILIDGRRLAELLIEYNVGVTIIDTLYLKKVDTDYFEGEG